MLNLTKTQYMLFGTNKRLINSHMKLVINDHVLERVSKYKYLGVWLDENLTWQKQVDETSKKISSRLALLGRLRKYLTVRSSKLLANSLILPYLDYCSNAWTNCAKYLKDVLVKQHKRMARLVLKVNYNTPTIEVLRK